MEDMTDEEVQDSPVCVRFATQSNGTTRTSLLGGEGCIAGTNLKQSDPRKHSSQRILALDSQDPGLLS